MTLNDEVNQLRQQGTTDDVITQLLARRGYQATEVTRALAASTIKEAVTAQDQGDQDLQPSLSAQPPQPEPLYQQTAPEQPPYADTSYQDQGYGSPGVSSDTITEIAEQVVVEKMSKVENVLNQLVLFKSTSESQLRSLDERLKRIENIIDKLQLSLLQRVGDYLTNTEDLKREVIETQKTVKTLAGRGTQAQPSSTRTRQSSHQVESE